MFSVAMFSIDVLYYIIILGMLKKDTGPITMPLNESMYFLLFDYIVVVERANYLVVHLKSKVGHHCPSGQTSQCFNVRNVGIQVEDISREDKALTMAKR